MDKKPVTFRLDTKLIDRVDDYANKHTGNKTKVVEMALKEFLDRNEFSATYVMGVDHGKANDPVFTTDIKELNKSKEMKLVSKNKIVESIWETKGTPLYEKILNRIEIAASEGKNHIYCEYDKIVAFDLINALKTEYFEIEIINNQKVSFNIRW